MLLEKPKSLENKIVSIKLVTGEEVIARVQQQDQYGSLHVTRPLSMIMMAGENDHQGMVAFAPWSLALEDSAVVVFGTQHVIHAGVARQDAAQQYSEAVGDSAGSVPRAATTQALGTSRGRR